MPIPSHAMHAHVTHAGKQEESAFFFEKKNQKTFIPLLMNKSLFASFSSEKEDSSFLP